MLFDTLTQISFKYAALQAGEFQLDWAWFISIFSHIWIYGAVIGYIGAFISWMTLLKHAPVGPAFAASHLEIVAVLIVSAYLFNESLKWIQIVGAVCIVLGIICLSMSESKQSES